MRVLVVDDYEVIRKIHITNLKKMGIVTIQEAVNGKEAVDAVLLEAFDLILMDWHMPIMNGIEALTILREEGVQTPIVFCTDEKQSESTAQALNCGADQYLVKPYTPTQFRSVISQFIK